MSRNTLHIGKLEAFKQWLSAEGIEHRSGNGDYQVLQVKWSCHWLAIYRRDCATEHLSSDRRLDRLVQRFCRSSK